MSCFIGVDPGLNGGITIMNNNEIITHVMPINTFKIKKKEFRYIDNKKLRDIFLNIYNIKEANIFIEDIHSLFGMSAKSNFSFGFGYGNLITTLDVFDLDYQKVTPKIWQKSVWNSKDIVRGEPFLNKKGILKDGKIDTKATSLNAVQRIYPDLNLLASKRCRVPHDGIVDATLIMLYGYMQNI